MIKIILYTFYIIFNLVVAFGLLYIARYYEATWIVMMTLFLVGFVFFTFVEYAVHAFIFHHPNLRLSQKHEKTHRRPQGYDGKPFIITMAIISPLYLLTFFLIEFETAVTFTAGIYFGFAFYALLHYVVHERLFGFAYFSYMVRFHDIHHIQPDKNHGISLPVWDYLFGTFIGVKK